MATIYMNAARIAGAIGGLVTDEDMRRVVSYLRGEDWTVVEEIGVDSYSTNHEMATFWADWSWFTQNQEQVLGARTAPPPAIEIRSRSGEVLMSVPGGRLMNANLRSANLEGATLHNADMYNADCYGANLSLADLSGARLGEANLRLTNLCRADLRGASLRRADLFNADLTGADLREGACLAEANLRQARLRDANLKYADLSRADLSRADLSRAILYRADLTGADLRRANLRGADLAEADLVEADLAGANLFGANLSHANLRRADLTGAQGLDPYKSSLWMVFTLRPWEAQGVLDALRAGKIAGGVFVGECAGLIGTIARLAGCGHYEVPGLPMDSDRLAEQWFSHIKQGDTPDNSSIARISEQWIVEWFKVWSGVRER